MQRVVLSNLQSSISSKLGFFCRLWTAFCASIRFLASAALCSSNWRFALCASSSNKPLLVDAAPFYSLVSTSLIIWKVSWRALIRPASWAYLRWVFICGVASIMLYCLACYFLIFFRGTDLLFCFIFEFRWVGGDMLMLAACIFLLLIPIDLFEKYF